MDEGWEWFCKISMVIMAVLLLNSIIGDLQFRAMYSFPQVSATAKTAINPHNDPVQINLKKTEFFPASGEKKKFILEKQAKYSISGLTVATNTNFFLRDVLRSDFDDLFLMDIGLTWGDLADKSIVKKYFNFKSKKTLGSARTLYPNPKGCYLNTVCYASSGSYKNFSYLQNHFSHTHLTPASANVMKALLTIKKWDVVRLDGYLVDVYNDKSEVIAKTSLSRDDTNATSRGYGACEVMYVTRVQIGDKVYK